jgi:hypothetical protein
MTASCFFTPLPVARLRVRPRQLLLPAVVVMVLAAAVLAPEQPAAQAEICERHNGVAACRVW